MYGHLYIDSICNDKYLLGRQDLHPVGIIDNQVMYDSGPFRCAIFYMRAGPNIHQRQIYYLRHITRGPLCSPVAFYCSSPSISFSFIAFACIEVTVFHSPSFIAASYIGVIHWDHCTKRSGLTPSPCTWIRIL